ncbi:MAG: hypothetical protein WC476_06065 [Phycisphaerae bacterium]|jgi:uncharacterized coiled-coil protein SlyX
METDTEKIVLQEAELNSHLEDLLLGMQRPELIAELQELIEETEKEKQSPDLDQIFQNNGILLTVITEQVRLKRAWQIVAAGLMISVVITAFICFGLYTTRANQTENLAKAEAAIQKANNDSAQAGQKVINLESQLADSKSQLNKTQAQLSDSNSEINNLQNQLADTTQRLKTLQDRNAEAVKRLNQRLQKLDSPR